MSDDKETAPATAKPRKKGRKLLMLAVLALAGGGAGGAYALGFIGGHKASAEVVEGPKLVPKTEQKRGGGGEGKEGEGASHGGGIKPPSGKGGDRYASNYYALDKEFTSNIQGSVHYIQVGIAVSTPYDDEVIENLKTNEIAVRSAILMTLGDASEEEVITSDGKAKLAKRLADAINATLKQKEGFGGIGNVYFTSFVVQ